jgi:hypothetical protein
MDRDPRLLAVAAGVCVVLVAVATYISIVVLGLWS